MIESRKSEEPKEMAGDDIYDKNEELIMAVEKQVEAINTTLKKLSDFIRES